MKPSAYKAALKAAFPDFDKVRIDAHLSPTGKGKPLRVNGHFIPALRAWGHSPVDVTHVGRDAARVTFHKVCHWIKGLRDTKVVNDYQDLLIVAFNEGTKDEFRVSVTLQRFPTYSPSQRMDPGYQTSYVVVRYAD